MLHGSQGFPVRRIQLAAEMKSRVITLVTRVMLWDQSILAVNEKQESWELWVIPTMWWMVCKAPSCDKVVDLGCDEVLAVATKDDAQK